MERPWLSQYPDAVPHDIDPGQYNSLVDLLDESFTKYADRPAFTGLGKTITYREVGERSRDMAAWLSSLKMTPGARVAVMMPNILQYPVCIAGVMRAGFILVNINPMYTARELEGLLRDSGAETIVVLETFAHTLAEVLPRTQVKNVVIARLGDLLGPVRGRVVDFMVRHVKKMVKPYQLPGAVSFRQVLARGRRMKFTPVAVGPDDVALLQYTGGTTGIPKGATLLHRNIVANVLQSAAWLQPALRKQAKVMPEQPGMLISIPLYHIFALTVCALLGMRSGALNILVPNPRDLPDLIGTMQKFSRQIVLFPAVNTLFNALLRHPKFAEVELPALRVAIGGGMAVQQSVAEAWLKRTGTPLCEGYGLSETAPSAISVPTDSTAYTGQIGLPLPSTEVKLLDDDGKEVAQGTPGELSIRGPQLMKGYWNQPGETACVMTDDGFFKTGDVAVMDERGFFRIVDRKKDMILVSGFNVYPNEVEDVAMQHPGVREAAAVGVPDAHAGETVKLFVVREDPNLTEQDVIAFCRERLVGYKRPRKVAFRNDLPKTTVGKILRRALREDTDGKPAA